MDTRSTSSRWGPGSAEASRSRSGGGTSPGRGMISASFVIDGEPRDR